MASNGQHGNNVIESLPTPPPPLLPPRPPPPTIQAATTSQSQDGNSTDHKEPHIETQETASSSTPKSEEPSFSAFPSIPITANKLGRAMAILLIFCNAAVTVLLLVFIFHPIYFSRSSNIITTKFAYMQLCINLPATAIGLFTANQLRRLFIQRFVYLNERRGLNPEERSECTAAVGVGSFREDVRSWKYGLSYLAAGVITAFVIACLVPTIVSIEFDLPATVYPNHDRDSCFTIGTNLSQLSPWSWRLPGEEKAYLGVNLNASFSCESQKVGNVAAAFSSRDPKYSYAIGGLLVDRAAVGAPIDPAEWSSGEFGTINRHSDFVWATQCFPSLKSNPVKCRPAPDAEFNVTTDSIGININGCNSTNQYLKVDPTVDGATIYAVCPDEKRFGAMSLVFGAVNDATLRFATDMQDSSFNFTETSYDSLNRSRISYAVECSIDIAPTVSYRQMALARIPMYQTGVVDNWPFHIVGDPLKPCTPKYSSGADIPLSSFLTERALVAGAISPRFLMNEGYELDGNMLNLHKFVSVFNPQNLPSVEPKQVYTFPESQNALEDALGTLTGIGLGMYWGAQFWNATDGGGTLNITNGKGGSTAWRMGTGQPWNVLYVIPTFACTFILSYLLYRGIRDGHL